MAIELHNTFTTDMVTKRTHKKIVRQVNREVGEFIAKRILPGKFRRTAFRKYAATYHRRSRRYRQAKRIKFGSASPNVRTGKMKRHVLTPGLGHKLRATSNRGRVYIKNYFPMPVWQRQELEVLNAEDRRKMAATSEKLYLKAVNDPENQRKRRRKK